MEADSTPVVALRIALDRAGSQVAFSRIVGITQQAVSKMLAEGRALAPEHVLAVEAATGVSRHDLRPDIYPRESDAAPLEGLRA